MITRWRHDVAAETGQSSGARARRVAWVRQRCGHWRRCPDVMRRTARPARTAHEVRWSPRHHVTTEYVVRAQFGGPFDAFSALRRLRSEIE